MIVGGIDMMTQSLMLAKKPHIVIGKTTVWNLLLKNCFVVLDTIILIMKVIKYFQLVMQIFGGFLC